MNSLIIVTRLTKYEGVRPIREHGYKCIICGLEWWPRYPGCNESCYPGEHHHGKSSHELLKKPDEPTLDDLHTPLEDYEF